MRFFCDLFCVCAYQSKFVRFGLAVLLLVSLKCNCTRIVCVAPPVLLRIYGTMIFRGGRGGGGGVRTSRTGTKKLMLE